jgi:prolyl-tRNA synthetase
MLWSKSFIPTLKETPQDAESISHQLMLRAGLIRMLLAGVYSYLPLGLKVLKHIEKIIRQEMNAREACELLLPTLQPLELWQRTGRDKDIGDVMIRFTDRRKRQICLGPTHEEVITDLLKNYISSYKQLPLILYQIQTKFRDEIRPRFGLVRSCEFIMKDAYSFDSDEGGLDKNYQAMLEAYKKIFARCGLNFLVTEADPGVMGGNVSHEFMVPASDGEDIVLLCPKCKLAKAISRTDIEPQAGSSDAQKDKEKGNCPKCNAKFDRVNTIEVGHIFKLGTKYSSVLGANFTDVDGKLKPIIMGCYGIGVSRLISAVIEQHNDKDGIIWPEEVSPYQVIILPLEVTDIKIMELANNLYKEFELNGIKTLLDDRQASAGVKFKDADLLGVPLQVIIGPKSLKEEVLELKIRRDNKRILNTKAEILKQIKSFF